MKATLEYLIGLLDRGIIIRKIYTVDKIERLVRAKPAGEVAITTDDIVECPLKRDNVHGFAL